MIVEKFPGRQIRINGEDHLYFGGTSYLGMSTNKEFQQLIFQGIKKWGASYGSSRNANVRLLVYEEAETLFSKWLGVEDSITVSSGAIAGKIVIDYLSKAPVTFFHYPRTHPAILAKDSLPLFIEESLHPRLLDNKKEDIVITVDAILSMEVVQTSFKFLKDISEEKTITLIVDESHSLGIIGKQGKGIFANVSIERLKRKIMISSLGKALGIPGGIIASDKEFINSVKNEAAFISSSGTNPPYLEAYINAKGIYQEQQQKLKSNLKYFFNELSEKVKSGQNPEYPVLYFNEKGFYKSLLQKGIVITSFDYPSYNEPMNRVVITANHTKDDLKLLANALNQLA